jgi:hypothetical protein
MVTVDVQPPYRARVVQTRDGEILSEMSWSESGTYLTRNEQVLQTAVIPPGFPGPMARLDIALPVAARQHLVHDLGREQTIAGQPCHMWRSREPLDGADLAAPSAANHTDSCVDESGRVLADDWTLRGERVRQRIATAVGPGPSLAGDGLFEGRSPVRLRPAEASTSVTRSDAGRLASLLGVPVPRPPAGMRLDTASAVLDLDGAREVNREAAVFTFLGEADRMLVLRLSKPLAPGAQAAVHGERIAVGVRTGRLRPVLAGLQLTLTGSGGLRATITADLPLHDLLGWAAKLDLKGSAG